VPTALHETAATQPSLSKVLCSRRCVLRKTTAYFGTMRARPDRSGILMAWIEQTILYPEHQAVQDDGRIRKWARIGEADGRYLRVILLEDNETVHNAFFDRGFKP